MFSNSLFSRYEIVAAISRKCLCQMCRYSKTKHPHAMRSQQKYKHWNHGRHIASDRRCFSWPLPDPWQCDQYCKCHRYL